jgi:hypothetical protein
VKGDNNRNANCISYQNIHSVSFFSAVMHLPIKKVEREYVREVSLSTTNLQTY